MSFHSSHALAELIAKMRHELKNRSRGYVARFEELLEQVAALNNPATTEPLLLLFDDEAEYDEVMFSIIHTIERFEDATYVRAIIDDLDSFFAASPRWTVIIHMRVLNSPSTMAAYADCMKTLEHNKLQVVRKVLEAVQRKNVKFETRCRAATGGTLNGSVTKLIERDQQ